MTNGSATAAAPREYAGLARSAEKAAVHHMCTAAHVSYAADTVPHPSEHAPPSRPLDADEAQDLTETLKALASPSRLRVLAELVAGERTVEQLAAAAGLSPSATSHNLRILRSLRLVRTRRDGRHAYYALYDHHVAELLAAVRHHHEHVNPPAPVDLLTSETEAVR
jgi:DNA-binding transcriptional ArsR family regulator